ncbi:MAG: hypothetical protein COT74_08170 [Bdellovibrionales bacterium CG10_big_fil_rev_8_21_14_0_10_45_34]|nr:MAG: hypothetical protein COT74_08170 [Bdellovibrionales bacterium CG10_big_fil_rev_8_21_14_0_10_45_34]
MKTTLRSSFSLAAAAIGFGIAGCSPVNFEKAQDTSAGTLPACVAANGCVTVQGYNNFNDFHTIQAPARKKDILIIIDNSGSMANSHLKMGEKFGSFISHLDSKGTDWQIVMTTTDAGEPSGPALNNAFIKGGQLMTFEGLGRKILRPSDANKEAIFYQTVKLEELPGFTSPNSASDTRGDERGIYAAIKALARNEDSWIRGEADFSVIILSDEDERSQGGNPNYANGAYPLEQGKDFPQDLIAAVKSKYGSRPFTAHAIVIPPIVPINEIPQKRSFSDPKFHTDKADPNSCYGQERFSDQQLGLAVSGFYGDIYAQLAYATGGTVTSICAPDFSYNFIDIANVVAKTTIKIPLKCLPKAEEPPTVEFVNESEYTPHTYSPGSLEIVFEDPPASPAPINVKYKCLANTGA